jgi:hypothetical protein
MRWVLEEQDRDWAGLWVWVRGQHSRSVLGMRPLVASALACQCAHKLNLLVSVSVMSVAVVTAFAVFTLVTSHLRKDSSSQQDQCRAELT